MDFLRCFILIVMLISFSGCDGFDMCGNHCLIASDDFGHPQQLMLAKAEDVDQVLGFNKPKNTGLEANRRFVVMKINHYPFVSPFFGQDQENKDVPLSSSKVFPFCSSNNLEDFIEIDEPKFKIGEKTPNNIPCTLREGRGLYLIAVNKLEDNKLDDDVTTILWRLTDGVEKPPRPRKTNVIHLGMMSVWKNYWTLKKEKEAMEYSKKDVKDMDYYEKQEAIKKYIIDKEIHFKSYSAESSVDKRMSEIVVYDTEKDVIVNKDMLEENKKISPKQLYLQIITESYESNTGGYNVHFVSGVKDAQTAGFSIVDGLIGPCRIIAKEIYSNLADSKLLKFFTNAMLVIYLISVATKIGLGMSDEPIHVVLLDSAKLIIVTLLVTSPESWDFFNGYLFEFIDSFINELQFRLEDKIGDPFGFLINFISKKEFSMRLFAILSFNPITWVYIVGIMAMFIFIFIEICLGYVIYAVAKISFWLIVAIGPIFLSFLLFEKTRQLSLTWLKSLMFYAIQGLIIYIILIISSLLVETTTKKYMSFDVVPTSINILGKKITYPRTSVLVDETDIINTLAPTFFKIGEKTCEPYECRANRYATMLNLDPKDSLDAEIISSMGNGQFVFFSFLIELGLVCFLLHYALKWVEAELSSILSFQGGGLSGQSFINGEKGSFFSISSGQSIGNFARNLMGWTAQGVIMPAKLALKGLQFGIIQGEKSDNGFVKNFSITLGYLTTRPLIATLDIIQSTSNAIIENIDDGKKEKKENIKILGDILSDMGSNIYKRSGLKKVAENSQNAYSRFRESKSEKRLLTIERSIGTQGKLSAMDRIALREKHGEESIKSLESKILSDLQVKEILNKRMKDIGESSVAFVVNSKGSKGSYGNLNGDFNESKSSNIDYAIKNLLKLKSEDPNENLLDKYLKFSDAHESTLNSLADKLTKLRESIENSAGLSTESRQKFIAGMSNLTEKEFEAFTKLNMKRHAMNEDQVNTKYQSLVDTKVLVNADRVAKVGLTTEDKMRWNNYGIDNFNEYKSGKANTNKIITELREDMFATFEKDDRGIVPSVKYGDLRAVHVQAMKQIDDVIEKNPELSSSALLGNQEYKDNINVLRDINKEIFEKSSSNNLQNIDIDITSENGNSSSRNYGLANVFESKKVKIQLSQAIHSRLSY